MTLSVRVTGTDRATRALDGLTKGMRTRLQRATKVGANEFKAATRARARPLSKRLARSVSVRAAKRNRPASVLTFRPKVAYFRHFIIGGTRPHGPKRAKVLVFQSRGGQVFARRVSGTPPHPILEQVFQQRHQAASNAMAEELFKET